MLIREEILKIRETYSINAEAPRIKPWEWCLLIFGCYIKEIIELLIVSFHKLNEITHNTSPSTIIGKLFQTFPFTVDLFWVLILKIILGFSILLYFYLRYTKDSELWCVLIYWLFSIGSSVITSFRSVEIISNPEILQLWFLFSTGLTLFFFFIVDKTNIDELKLLIYDGLEVNELSGRVYKTPWTKVSRKKIENLFLSCLGAVTFSLVFYFIINWIVRQIAESGRSAGESKGGKPSVPTSRNQESIEARARENIFQVAFSSIIIAPVIEELIFRKCLMRVGNYKWWTMLGSGFIFGVIHLHQEPIITILPYLIPGLIFGSLFYVSKNIWHCIFSHSMFNTLSLIGMLINHPPK